ncbi:glycoside hydrolase superfamily [Cokeromyces recurvatus]|uniref:glycoside hydrolase superfamily n=1 Tax=Cokeromyces recurvatus TaxID=90255 RepID=UPI00221F25DF|nr:glycoside hydrolase superfamily [Cokeromyces recurvatus]KAI7899033.1 glycoside hydrolase superfamily [Cokeromyces recurvatus]
MPNNRRSPYSTGIVDQLNDANYEMNGEKGSDKDKDNIFFKRFMKRHPKWISRIGVVFMFVFLISILLVLPLTIAGINKNRTDQQSANDLPSFTTDHDSPISFDDTARVNSLTPPLNEKFRYNAEDRIRGINLGGWLVLEPFITPSIFEQTMTNNTVTIVDEWTLCKQLGPIEAKSQLERHYKTFITEADFKKIAMMGFNHVRIPVGHWAISVTDDEPYVPDLSWRYLLKGIEWARKYGLRVMVELHTAPGSQNGWNHSGRQGSIGFLKGTNGTTNAKRTTKIVSDMVEFFNLPEWSNVVTLFGVLNEPAMMSIPPEQVKKWYHTVYDQIRKALKETLGPLLSFHDGFMPLNQWAGFFKNSFQNTIIETHLYLIFNNDLVSMPKKVQSEFPCNAWKKDLQEVSTSVGPMMVGEFSLATNDCAKYLNGIGFGARYDNTYEEDSNPNCPSCTCKGVDDWENFTNDYKQFLLQFLEKQMDAYESSLGWFFWTYKTEDHVNPHWDYSLAWEQGFAPSDFFLLSYLDC